MKKKFFLLFIFLVLNKTFSESLFLKDYFKRVLSDLESGEKKSKVVRDCHVSLGELKHGIALFDNVLIRFERLRFAGLEGLEDIDGFEQLELQFKNVYEEALPLNSLTLEEICEFAEKIELLVPLIIMFDALVLDLQKNIYSEEYSKLLDFLHELNNFTYNYFEKIYNSIKNDFSREVERPKNSKKYWSVTNIKNIVFTTALLALYLKQRSLEKTVGNIQISRIALDDYEQPGDAPQRDGPRRDPQVDEKVESWLRLSQGSQERDGFAS
ncbi:hypothetical protein KAW80_04670 [Candidatus Babeliales bacterium]|nr:hypothetical protein [Candidatus Babeliales bacterium]